MLDRRSRADVYDECRPETCQASASGRRGAGWTSLIGKCSNRRGHGLGHGSVAVRGPYGAGPAERGDPVPAIGIRPTAGLAARIR